MVRDALTYLYVPGDRPERFDKAAASGAGAIVLDLEDAVPLREKAVARSAAARWLHSRDPDSVPVWVRINSDENIIADLEAVIPAAPTGIWLPKCNGVSDLVALDEALSALEGDVPIPVSPLIETAAGLWNVREICTGPRVAFIQLGEVDLAADLGSRPGPDGSELLWARSRAVTASAAAGIAPPLGPASPEIRDLAAFTRDTERIQRLGFEGRACIHPSQLEPVATVFAPSADDVEAARGLLDVFAAAQGAAVVGADGRLIDEAVARNARRVLARVR